MKLTSRIIAKILTLCGISLTCTACYAPGYARYYGDFTVRGVVTDAQTGLPVKGIKVVVAEWDADDDDIKAAGITDSGGYYDIEGGWNPGELLTVSTEDIDGAENGDEFAPETVEVRIDADDYVGGDGWYRGTVTKTADFELTLKTENDDENE